uniref:DNA-directed RNA polymerase III subunit RPC6 n=2 Tax=Viridiplantae TaxID=33090 RepID=A0A7R9TEA1_9VIRI|eukprot:PRCOL_00004812-RA
MPPKKRVKFEVPDEKPKASAKRQRKAEEAADHAILKAIRERADGLPNADLSKATAGVCTTQAECVDAINRLLASHKIQVFKKDSSLYYKEANEEDRKKQGLGSEELLVLQIIKEHGNQGIWIRDLKARCNLQQPQVSKILKSLEGRQVIKAVKSVQSKNRKVYMLFELEPSRDITGGAWWTDHEFDLTFVTMLRDATCKLVEHSGSAGVTISDIAEQLEDREVSQVPLKPFEVREIVETLAYDDIIVAKKTPELEAKEEEDREEAVRADPSPRKRKADDAKPGHSKVDTNKEFVEDGTAFIAVPPRLRGIAANALARATALLRSPDYNQLLEETSRRTFPLKEPSPEPEPEVVIVE